MARPTTADEYIARGFDDGLAANDCAGAGADFRRAFQLRPDGRTAALMGYCRGRCADPAGAVGQYRDAIERGYRQAWVHNDLAFALIQMWLRTKDRLYLQQAVAEAHAALDRDPKCRAALYNRAWARFELTVERPALILTDVAAIAALDGDLAALLADPPDGHLPHVLAARILAAPTRAAEPRLADAVQQVQTAVSLGWSITSAIADPVTCRLRDRADFKAIILPELPVRLSAPDPALLPPVR
jgi:hypothetical protein